jgi:hypothetical protein
VTNAQFLAAHTPTPTPAPIMGRVLELEMPLNPRANNSGVTDPRKFGER